MFREFKPFFIIAESPLHPGSGSELGIVDLPVQRERHTNYPKIEGSGLKGSIREAFENLKETNLNSHKIKDKELKNAVNLAFGPEDGEKYAGSLAFTDAKILLFPVKSLKGTFAWITCPYVLERFLKDMRIRGVDLKDIASDLHSLENSIPEGSNITVLSKIVLEEFSFEVKEKSKASKVAKWFAKKIFPQGNSNDPYKYWREKMAKDLVILLDDDFKEFISTSTEVIARTKIASDTGTVTSGGLWYEEYLSQDTILYSLAMTSPIRMKDDAQKGVFKANNPQKEAEKVMDFFEAGLPEVLQIGGNQTIGKGIVRIQILK